MLLHLIKSDLARWDKPSFWNFFKNYFNKGISFKYSVWLRIIHSIKKKHLLKILLGPFVYIKFHSLSFKYGITVDTNMDIGEGFKVVHTNGVFLNAVAIGKNFTCFQNVTIGINNGKKPIVGNDVVVYANSMIIGETIVGNQVTIGCFTLVNKSIDDGALICGIPFKKIEKK